VALAVTFIWIICLEAVIKTCMKLTIAEYSGKLLMMAKKMPETCRVLS
jgi:hypothetical protein